MNLIDFIYQQKSYGELLYSLGLSLEDINLIPFPDGKTLIADKYGNTEGFIMENAHGGVDVTDWQMNKLGSANAIHDFTYIHDENFQIRGIVEDNVLGGLNVYDSSRQLNLISTENLFYGRDYYDSAMQLLGSSSETIKQITTISMNDSVEQLSSLDIALEAKQFSHYLDDFKDFTIENLDIIDIWSVEAAELFDLFDLFG